MSNGDAFGPQVVSILHDKEFGRLVRWIADRGVSHHDAEDLAQETFTRLWAKREGSVDDPGAYLYRIARNLVKNLLRHRAVESRCRGDQLPTPTRSPTPEQLLRLWELEDVVAACVDDLPKGPREVFLQFMLGLEAAEIAALRGTTPATVHVQLHRARAAIRDAI